MDSPCSAASVTRPLRAGYVVVGSERDLDRRERAEREGFRALFSRDVREPDGARVSTSYRFVERANAGGEAGGAAEIEHPGSNGTGSGNGRRRLGPAGAKVRSCRSSPISFVASPDDAARYESLITTEATPPTGRYERREHGGLTPLVLKTLWAILERQEWNPDVHALVYIGEPGDTWLAQFPEPFVARLVAVSERERAAALIVWRRRRK